MVGHRLYIPAKLGDRLSQDAGSIPAGGTMKYEYVEVGPNRYEVRLNGEKFNVAEHIKHLFESGQMVGKK